MGGGLTVDSTQRFPFNCHQLFRCPFALYLRWLSKIHELSCIKQVTVTVVRVMICIYMHDINLQLGINDGRKGGVEVEVEGLLGAPRAAL